MRDHHLVAVAFSTEIIGTTGEESASIIVIHAHLWLIYASPSIGDVLENTGWLLIKIE